MSSNYNVLRVNNTLSNNIESDTIDQQSVPLLRATAFAIDRNFYFLEKNNGSFDVVLTLPIVIRKKPDNDLDVEMYAIKYYQDQGFDIVSKFDSSLNFINLPVNIKKLHDTLEKSGKPDLIIIPNRNRLDYFFLVEVKSAIDGYRVNQILWAIRHPEIRIELFIVL